MSLTRVGLARQQLSDTGVIAAYSPAVIDGHAVENTTGKLILHVKNDSDINIDVTIRSGYTVNGLKLTDRIVSITPHTSIFIGPFDPKIYNQTDGLAGQIAIDYSAVDGVSVVALLIP
jgi:hypothetical protein